MLWRMVVFVPARKCQQGLYLVPTVSYRLIDIEQVTTTLLTGADSAFDSYTDLCRGIYDLLANLTGGYREAAQRDDVVGR